MRTEFEPLLATIRRDCPAARLEPLSEVELAAIRKQFPGVPEHYLDFLRHVGYGSLGGIFMVYSGPVEPGEIFDPAMVAGLGGLMFFGDSFGGTLVGFDTRNGWHLVRVDDHSLQIDREEARTVGEFIARWIADCQ